MKICQLIQSSYNKRQQDALRVFLNFIW